MQSLLAMRIFMPGDTPDYRALFLSLGIAPSLIPKNLDYKKAYQTLKLAMAAINLTIAH